MTKRHWEGLCIAAVVCAYVASLVLPVTAQHSGSPRNPDFGCQYFVLGLVFILAGYFWVILYWFPNLLLIVGVVLLLTRRNRTAMILGMVATLGASWWLWGASPMGPGYYCWLASMVLLAVAGGCRAVLAGRNVTTEGGAEQARPVIPDPGALALFRPSCFKPPLSLEVRRGAPQDDRPPFLQPPCSPSS